MSNETLKNLVPLTERNKEDAKEIRSKGGKASGAVRRRKRDLKKTMESLIDSDIPLNHKKTRALLAGMGIEEDDMTYSVALCGTILMKALQGNVRAMELIINMTGQNAMQELEKQKFAYQKKKDKQEQEMLSEKDTEIRVVVDYGDSIEEA